MKISYRPEIDGLRAIAVCAVVFYHAQITILDHQPFNGGFIGVDIFFVISGYLITSIILKELIANGTFSFRNFYERRIRRIIPALLFMMLASLPFAWMYLLPMSFVDFSKSILYSLGFSSNLYFWYSGQLYGATSGWLKPFLHTWSLSVEEQFYILFPVVLLIIFKYLRKFLIHILLIGFVVSLGLADWGSRNHPSFNFYVLPTRCWELLAGSILAYFEITLGHRSKNKILNLILPSVGMFLILHSVIFFNDKMFHPSFYTLSPITGVCLIIWFSHKNEIITKIISTKFFVGIGLISYSLYLWHYPILTFARINELIYDNETNKLFFIFISLIFSLFSYYFIELQFRSRKYKFKLILSLIITLILILIIVSLSIIFKKGFNNRLPEILDLGIQENFRDEKTLKSCGNVLLCYKNLSSKDKIILIGDSIAGSISNDLKEKVIRKNYQFVSAIRPGCIYLFQTHIENNNRNCKKFNLELDPILQKENNSIFIFIGSYKNYLNNYDQRYFIKGIEKLSINNKVLLIYPLPESDFDVPKKLFKSLPKNKNLINDYLIPENYVTISYKKFKIMNNDSFKFLDEISGDNIVRIYPHKIFCNTLIKNKCITHDDKSVFYRDFIHLTSKGADLVNKLVIKEIEKIEFRPR